MIPSKRSGFTLIELLVVITIIGILAAIVYASFDGARQQARNRALMTEMRELQLALEVYKAQNGSYPSGSTYPSNVSSVLVPNFIASVPVNSDSGSPNCNVTYQSDGTYYKLTAVRCYEGATTVAKGIGQNDEFARCPSSCSSCAGGVTTNSAAFYESLAVYSAGGECL